jgi:hypothetical protein
MVAAPKDEGVETMASTRWWVAAPLALGLVVAACSGDADATPAPTAAAPAATAAAPAATDTPATDAPSANDAGASVGTLTLGAEVIAIDRLFCFFEEQPRAGLGGVFTHTAQGRATNAAGEPLVLDVSRARDEDGTVGDDVIIDIGDFRTDDAVSYRTGGPEGLVEFGDASISSADIQVSGDDGNPVAVSFDVTCG